MKVKLEIEENREMRLADGRVLRRLIRFGDSYDWLQLAQRVMCGPWPLPYTQEEFNESKVVGHRIWLRGTPMDWGRLRINC